MSEYTRSLEKIFFLNDKSVISSLNDETVLLNPVTSQKVTQNVYSKLNGQDNYISGEVKRLCCEISSGIGIEIEKLSCIDSEIEHQFVTKVTEANGKIEVFRSRPTSADIDQLENYVTKEIRLSNDALSTEVSAQMYRSAKDLSTYINNKVSIAYKAMGSKPTYDDLTSMSHSWGDTSKEEDWPKLSTHIGEVWNVIGASRDNPEISGQNYVWVHQENPFTQQLAWGWDVLGGIIDFSIFYTKEQANQISSILSSSIIETADNKYLHQDGSKATQKLSVVDGISGTSLYLNESHQNPDEHTILSVGSQGFNLDVNGSRSIDISCPNGYDGITVNGESISSFVTTHGGSGATKNPLHFYNHNNANIDSFDGSVEKILKAGENVEFVNSGNVIEISAGGGVTGNFFNLDTDNVVSTETTFLSSISVDFKNLKDGKNRSLSDVVSVENNFASMYNGIANIKAECKLTCINDFNLASQISTAFDSINKIATDPQIDVPIVPLNTLNASISDGFNALTSIILSAKYNAYGVSLDETLKKIDDRFDTMEKSLAEMNHRLSAIEHVLNNHKIVITK